MYPTKTVSKPPEEMPAWLASLILKRGGGPLARFAVHYQRLASMPRAWRLRLRRKLAVSMGSAALIMALAGPIALAQPEQPVAPAATITVVNGEVANVNNGKCGLIEAIINARMGASGTMRPDCAAGNRNGPDTVSLPTNGEFVLTQAHNDQFGPTGLPVITSAVTIDGHGSTIRRDDVWEPRFRILAVDENGSLTLNNATISNGWIDVSNRGYYGGGIVAYGSLTLSGSTIRDNTVWGWAYLSGGGVFANGETTITDSAITGNSLNADYSGMGGGLSIGVNGHATITNSVIADNATSGYYGNYGAGINVSGQVIITDSVIADNVNTGDMYTDSGDGGGVFVWPTAMATITGSTLSGNVVRTVHDYGYSYEYSPGYGGALANMGTTEITNSTISGNTAGYGGGLANIGNGLLTVSHTTVTGNDAPVKVSIYDYAFGGYGGGLFAGQCTQTWWQGAIVSGNTAGQTGPQAKFVPGGVCGSAMNVDAFNVFGQNGNAGLVGFSKGASDVVPSVGLSAILSPLANNGGPTLTHALPAGSPALDLAPNASCTAAPVNGVDQRGQPRNQNAVGGATNNECDAGSFERAGSVAAMGFYLSASGSGSVGGVAFAPGDIIKFTPPNTWAMHFDASDVGISKNVTAFEIEADNSILLSLAAAQNVPGAGNVQPQDVIRFTPTSTGNTTAGSFALALDGSANLLTTSGEKIDALGRTNGRIALSTMGAAAVKRPDNTVLKAQDEDALGFNLSNGQWSEFFNGTAIPGLGAEDINGLWIDETTGDLYVSIVGAFNLGGISGNGRDIVKLTPSGAPGGYTPSLFWDGSANGFPTNVDGLEMIP